MDDEFNTVDEGDEFAPTVSGEEGEGEFSSSSSSLNADSAEETKEEEASDEVAPPVPEGETVSDAKTEDEKGEESDKSLDEVLADVEKEIADEKRPKWYKANLGAVKTAFLRETEGLKATVDALSDYGEVEQIKANLEIVKGLESYETDPSTNLPTRTVKPFVEKLVETKGFETAEAVFLELGSLSSPTHQGWNMFHELMSANGLDPTRLDDFKNYAKNGYTNQTPDVDPDDLEQIPENLREAFISLAPDERDELLISNERLRNLALQKVQDELDGARQKEIEAKESEARSYQEKIEQQQKFYQDINERTGALMDESGSRLFNSFTESLVSSEIDGLEAIGIANTMSIVLNSSGIEGRASREALEKIGVKLDASLEETFSNWMQEANRAASFEKQGNEDEYKKALDRFQDLETKLIRKANPIIAGILSHRAKSTQASVSNRNSRLNDVTKQNNGISHGRQEAIETGNQGITDFSESAYLASEF